MNKKTYIENILETINDFNWKVTSLFIDNNCIFAYVDKFNSNGDVISRNQIEGLYAASDSDTKDVFNVYFELFKKLNLDNETLVSENDIYFIQQLVPISKDSLDSSIEVIDGFTNNLGYLYTLFLDNQENLPLNALKLALEQINKYYINASAYDKVFFPAYIKLSTKVDNSSNYWKLIRDVQVLKVLKGAC